jgi:hypothetical protein
MAVDEPDYGTAYRDLRTRVAELVLLTTDDHTFGDEPATASCRTTKFEFVRAATGRRSLEQMAQWDWDGDARTELVVMPIFTARPEPLVE